MPGSSAFEVGFPVGVQANVSAGFAALQLPSANGTLAEGATSANLGCVVRTMHEFSCVFAQDNVTFPGDVGKPADPTATYSVRMIRRGRPGQFFGEQFLWYQDQAGAPEGGGSAPLGSFFRNSTKGSTPFGWGGGGGVATDQFDNYLLGLNVNTHRIAFPHTSTAFGLVRISPTQMPRAWVRSSNQGHIMVADILLWTDSAFPSTNSNIFGTTVGDLFTIGRGAAA